ncbi:MAG: glycine--tRNA ligase [Candidatus Omnitrophica bacterium]|nr:glycine--tRNA ligase [Candidatus Omnitrophota bacterium]
MAESDLMDKIVALCKRRGFIFQSSEIYGGLNGAWDYGPLGAELKRNLKNAWWQAVVHYRDDVVGLDASVLMHPATWKASGHADNFTDTLVDCKKCKRRYRQDHLKGKCPDCGSTEFTQPRAFNLMLKTNVGAMEDSSSTVYLRPETAQGIFVNFTNVLDVTHRKLPFGIAQIGKAFRNEVTPGNFTFRTREFEQMEIEYFCRPQEAPAKYREWIQARFGWYIDLGIKKENLQLREHGKDELAHYAAGCTDVEYKFPFGWSELEGIANRTDYDLKQHAQFSGKDLQYQDPLTNEKFYPYVIEPSGGCDRATLAFLVDAYQEETVNDQTRVVLKFHSKLSPIKVAVLPLLKKNDGIVALAQKIKTELQKDMICVYDDTAAIGKLYRRQDEVGTFFCVTIDVQSLEDKQVTVRHRDTMKQDRVSVDRLKEYLTDKLRTNHY